MSVINYDRREYVRKIRVHYTITPVFNIAHNYILTHRQFVSENLENVDVFYVQTNSMPQTSKSQLFR